MTENSSGVRSARGCVGTTLTCVTVIAGIVAMATAGFHYYRSQPGAVTTPTVSAGYFVVPGRPQHPVNSKLPPRVMSYLGVYEPGAPNSYTSVQYFSHAIKRQVNIALYYSAWEEQFEETFAKAAGRAGAIPLIQINPRRISLAALVAGKYDGYLTAFADEVAAYRSSVIIGFGHEMNGPWSGWGYRHTPPAEFIAAWRHVVTVFRKQGADNVTWLWTVNRTCPQCGPVHKWWPGSRYVTWIGIDGYYYRPTDTFRTIFGPMIADVRRFTKDPILIAETAVGPMAGQSRGIRNLVAGVRAGHDLGFVWFDKPRSGSIYHQDWRLEDSPKALAAFRRAVHGMRLVRP